MKVKRILAKQIFRKVYRNAQYRMKSKNIYYNNIYLKYRLKVIK